MSLFKVSLPFFEPSVQAGFPSPADDFVETSLNLHTHLVKHPSATFFVRASGDSMIGAGIFSGDLLVVDRAINATDNHVVLAVINGEMTVKRLRRWQQKLFLMPENKNHKPTEVKDAMAFSVWGVVTHVIHAL